jgi:ElaB/YqjD/DUF883 family membrane-anchored ribosome-binding protein
MATTDKATDELKADLAELRADLAALKDDMKTLAGALKDVSKDSLSAAKENVMNKARQVENAAEEKVAGAYNTVRDGTQQAVGVTREQIEEHPLSIVLGSFLGGMLVAKLLGRD